MALRASCALASAIACYAAGAYPWTWENAAGTRAHLRDGYRYCPHSTAHPSALAELSVIIDADGEDRWIEREGWSDYRAHNREALIERIHQYGVAGLGGAGFPTGVKLQGGGDKITTLIINAAECEPYITADDRLMQDCAAQIVEGVRIRRIFCNRVRY